MGWGKYADSIFASGEVLFTCQEFGAGDGVQGERNGASAPYLRFLRSKSTVLGPIFTGCIRDLLTRK